MAEQHNLFLESLMRQAQRPIKGTALGNKITEGNDSRIMGSAKTFHGNHPNDKTIDPDQDFWYGKSRGTNTIGKGFGEEPTVPSAVPSDRASSNPTLADRLKQAKAPAIDHEPSGVDSYRGNAYSTEDNRFAPKRKPGMGWKQYLQKPEIQDARRERLMSHIAKLAMHAEEMGYDDVGETLHRIFLKRTA